MNDKQCYQAKLIICLQNTVIENIFQAYVTYQGSGKSIIEASGRNQGHVKNL